MVLKINSVHSLRLLEQRFETIISNQEQLNWLGYEREKAQWRRRMDLLYGMDSLQQTVKNMTKTEAKRKKQFTTTVIKAEYSENYRTAVLITAVEAMRGYVPVRKWTSRRTDEKFERALTDERNKLAAKIPRLHGLIEGNIIVCPICWNEGIVIRLSLNHIQRCKQKWNMNINDFKKIVLIYVLVNIVKQIQTTQSEMELILLTEANKAADEYTKITRNAMVVPHERYKREFRSRMQKLQECGIDLTNSDEFTAKVLQDLYAKEEAKDVRDINWEDKLFKVLVQRIVTCDAVVLDELDV